ncbi:MAG TPA: FtsX-like permease family protein [Longimicrobiales bacterium]
MGQRAYRNAAFLLRTAGDAAALTAAARAAVAELDPDLPVYQALTMDQHLAESMSDDVVLARLLGVFGGIALTLAVIGVHGVMAYSVAQRTREVGIRMALGAQAGSIQALVLRQGAKLAAAGAVAGLLLALAVTRTLSAFLFGVSPFDALTFAVVMLAILAAALAASWISARCATRVDPVVALRAE